MLGTQQKNSIDNHTHTQSIRHELIILYGSAIVATLTKEEPLNLSLTMTVLSFRGKLTHYIYL